MVEPPLIVETQIFELFSDKDRMCGHKPIASRIAKEDDCGYQEGKNTYCSPQQNAEIEFPIKRAFW